MGGFCLTGGPMPLGHEVSGTVDWVGPEVEGTTVGQRVVVFPGDPDTDGYDIIGNGGAEGGLTELLVVRGAARGGRVFPVPDDLPLDVAALAEPLAVGMKSAMRTGAGRGDKVAVFGCGPIGLSAIATLAERGADVVGVDLSARRLDLAGEMGAGSVLDPSACDLWEELARLHGADEHMGGTVAGTQAFIEATGSAAVINDIVGHARPNSMVSLVAVHMEPVELSLLAIMSKQLEVKGSIGYPTRFEDSVDMLTRRDLSSMITHRIPLTRFDEALEVLGSDRDCGKVLVANSEGL
jgi:threonine dehydrogenase-like Zn-dependent dehydrogenase